MRRSLAALVVVLVACGGRVVSEPDDAPATDTMSAPAPSSSETTRAATASTSMPATCACSSVTVRCSTSVGYASSDRARCEIDVAATTCGELGFTDGQVVSPRAILDAPVPRFTQPVELYAFCATKHEARHTCDPASVRSCTTEQTAYAVSRSCFEQYRAQYCASADAPSWCDRVTNYVDGSQASLETNACLCASGATCSSCTSSCEQAWPDVTSACDEAASAYCAVNGK